MGMNICVARSMPSASPHAAGSQRYSAQVPIGACRALARRHPATRVERPLPHLSVTRPGVADSSAVRTGGERRIADGAEWIDAVCRFVEYLRAMGVCGLIFASQFTTTPCTIQQFLACPPDQVGSRLPSATSAPSRVASRPSGTALRLLPCRQFFKPRKYRRSVDQFKPRRNEGNYKWVCLYHRSKIRGR
jgi:hypothetical protein